MEFKLPNEVEKILEKFTKAGFQIYIVGGAVRDLIMKRAVKDWDFTTDAKPEEILKLFPDGFYNNKFGTVGLETKLGVMEITTMRHEGDYTDHRHPVDVSWTNKIEEDLGRRDFTVNAIAIGSSPLWSNSKFSSSETEPSREVTIVDPYNGQEDIQKKLIRAVRDPNLRFKEDALRLLRAVRIATELNFKIEEKTLAALKKNAESLKEISWERIRDELFKILATDDPYSGLLKLKETGLLRIILPEVERCFGIVQQGPKHDRSYDIGEHSLLSLKFCPSIDPLVRLAALIHDIGKPDTFKTAEDGNVTFYGHDVVGGSLSKKISERLHLSKKDSEKLFRLVRFHLFTVDENQTDSAIRRFIKNVGLENIADMMDLRVGDRLGGGTEKAISWRMEKFSSRIKQVLQKPFSISDLKVNGQEVMETLGISPGPKVGQVLEMLFKEVLEDASKNNRDYLLKRIKQLI